MLFNVKKYVRISHKIIVYNWLLREVLTAMTKYIYIYIE